MRKQVELLTGKLESVTLPAWKANAYNGHSEQQASSTYIQDFPSLPKQSGTQERNVQQTLPDVQHDKPTRSSSEETWQQVNTKKRPKKQKLVIGQSAKHTSFSGVSRKSVVCITRLTPDTSVDSVSNHLKTNGINLLSCFDVSPDVENLKFRTLRVCLLR